MSKNTLNPVALTLASMTICSASLATEWRAEPSLSLDGQVDDNIRLISDDSLVDTAYGGVLQPAVKVSARNPAWELSATGRLQFERFWGVDGVDQNNKYLTLAGNREFELSTLKFSGNIINDTNLQTDTDPDAGLSVDKVNRWTFGGTGTWSRELTPRYALETGLTGSYRKYDDGEDEGLFDYYFIQPSVGLSYRYSERTRLSLTYDYGYINPDRPDGQTSKTQSLLAGFKRAFTERLDVDFAAGVRHTKTDSDIQVLRVINGVPTVVEEAQDDSTTGLTFRGGFDYEFDNGNWGLTASRDVRPSGNGTSSDRTGLIFRGNRQWTERFSTGVKASFFRNRSVGDVNTTNDRNNYRVSPNASYRLTRDLSLTAQYIFRRVERDETDENATSNAGLVGLTYQWPRISVSR